MIDIVAGQKIGGALGWLLTLGASDTKAVRQEMEDLLVHCTSTLKSLVELCDALNSLTDENFDVESFRQVYYHCQFNYTMPEAAVKARTHCTDIERDIERITFKITKLMRTELGRWADVDKGFGELRDADLSFLDRFEEDMKRVNDGLKQVNELISKDKDVAWIQFENLRDPLLEGMKRLSQEIDTMQRAQDHVRRLLT